MLRDHMAQLRIVSTAPESAKVRVIREATEAPASERPVGDDFERQLVRDLDRVARERGVHRLSLYEDEYYSVGGVDVVPVPADAAAFSIALYQTLARVWA